MTHRERMIAALERRIPDRIPTMELEFQLGFNEGKGEFFFFHFGNKHLMRDGQAWAELMPADLKARWTVILEK